MVKPEDTSVTIAGAGIIGLTTALQLHTAGFRDVHIFEKARQVAELGVGLGLQPSATLAFRNLGLLPALEAHGVALTSTYHRDRWGNLIYEQARGRETGIKAPGLLFHRGKLQAILLDAVKERLGSDKIHLDRAFESSEEVGGKITARFVSRDKTDSSFLQREADVLIGADGINSTVRATLYPNEGPARFSGRTLWRGSTWHKSILDGRSLTQMGTADKGFFTYPISPPNDKGEQLLNWVCSIRTRAADDPDKTPPANVSWDVSVPKDGLLAEFKDWPFGEVSLNEVLEKSNPIWLYPMSDRDPLERWSFGRLTLIGDAAHPMYPIGGNGASQGIIDVVCLVGKLVAAPDIATALKEYESERLPATAKVVLANRGTDGGIHQLVDLVQQRAPNGFDNIEDVVSKEDILQRQREYAQATGNALEMVNKQWVETEGTAERLGLKSPANWT